MKLSDEYMCLYRAFLSLKTEEECAAFLKDLCSDAELDEMTRRLTAARLLSKNVVYSAVTGETGLSTTTISRVSRALKNGTGYRTVLPRIEKNS